VLNLRLQDWIWGCRSTFENRISSSGAGSEAPGLDLRLQGWILGSRIGFQVPGLDLRLQGWL